MFSNKLKLATSFSSWRENSKKWKKSPKHIQQPALSVKGLFYFGFLYDRLLVYDSLILPAKSLCSCSAQAGCPHCQIIKVSFLFSTRCVHNLWNTLLPSQFLSLVPSFCTTLGVPKDWFVCMPGPWCLFFLFHAVSTLVCLTDLFSHYTTFAGWCLSCCIFLHRSHSQLCLGFVAMYDLPLLTSSMESVPPNCSFPVMHVLTCLLYWGH